MHKVNKYFWIFGFIFIFVLKLFFIFINQNSDFFAMGGGNDSNYYEEVVSEGGGEAVNVWPLFLMQLDKFGLFSRKVVSFFLFFLSSLLIPYMVTTLFDEKVHNKLKKKKYFWISMFFLGVYPALFYYSLDMYRDVFMVFIFLIGINSIKKMLKTRSLIWCLIAISITFPLYGLRSYLGAVYFLTVIFSIFISHNRVEKILKINIVNIFLCYLIFIYIIYLVGGFSALLNYRDSFENTDGGSNLGLNLNSVSMFLPNFIISHVFQLFGFWPFGGGAVVLFLVEGLPFTLIFLYILKNRISIDKFNFVLMIFFVLYNTVWIIGNDNLGTAWRLRIFSYIIAYTVFMNILIKKNEKVKAQS